jgi:hypothetical protein
LRVHCCQLIFSPLPDILLHYGSMGDGAMRHCYMLDVPQEMVPWDTYMLDVYPSRVHAQFFVRFVAQFSIFCAMFWRSLFILYFFAIVLMSFWLPPLVSLIFLYNINMWCTERLVLFTLTGKHWWSKKPV